ncbi:MAG TPA: lysophospholipid transporter LplT [bacterium]|nr:lysophospholipid transporter LplT [bacterium]
MSNNSNTHLPMLHNRAMLALLTAQFLSALADNALLIVAIATLKAQLEAGNVPWLQIAFVLPFILLAPFVGVLADAMPKGRVLLIGNGVKLLGGLSLLLGAHPIVAYGIAGIGAAIYSPAKFGILTQLFPPQSLVRANSLLEGSTIVAILLGVFLGGLLTDYDLDLALTSVIGLFFLAALINLLIPRLPIESPLKDHHLGATLRSFGRDLATLYRIPDARASLLATTSFWGLGATMRLMLFAWVPLALGVADNSTPSNLMGAVSIGIVFGAAIAGLLIPLHQANRALIGGLLLGPLVMLLALTQSLPVAVALLIALGAAGGMFVVPMNAMLQNAGHRTIGAGRALAVQNLWENMAMMLFVGLYLLLSQLGVSIVANLFIFGAVLLVLTGLISWLRLRQAQKA